MNNIVTKVVFLIILTFNLSIVFSQVPGKPANSYVSGQNWYCVDGFQKSGNECVSIFANFPSGKPSNSYVSGQNWYCVDGFQKSGNSCVSIFANFPSGKPANSYVSGQNWYCVDGFKKSGNECISIFSSELIVQNQKPKNSKVVEDIPVTAVQSSEKVQKTVIVKKQNNTSNTAISGGLPPIRQ